MKIRKIWSLLFSRRSSVYFRHLQKSYTIQDSMAAVSCPASSQIVYHQGRLSEEVCSERVVLSFLTVKVNHLKPRGSPLLWSGKKAETHFVLIFMASTKVKGHNSHFSLPTWYACLPVSLVLQAPVDYPSEAWTWQYFFLAVVRLSPEPPSVSDTIKDWGILCSLSQESLAPSIVVW